MRLTSNFETRCLKCGFRVTRTERGHVAAYYRRLTLWRCPQCQRLRWAVVRDVD